MMLSSFAKKTSRCFGEAFSNSVSAANYSVRVQASFFPHRDMFYSSIL